MHRDTTEEEVFRIIRSTLQKPDLTLSLDDSLLTLSSDSIQLFDLLTAFERAYSTKTTYEDIVRIHTVGDIVAYIDRIKRTRT